MEWSDSLSTNRLVSKLLVVIVNLGHRDNTRILFKSRDTFLLLPKIEDTPNERTNQSDSYSWIHSRFWTGRTGFSACNSLRKGEEESHIAVETLFLEFLGSFDSFPGWSDFEQDSVRNIDTSLWNSDENENRWRTLIEGGKLVSFGNASLSVVAQMCIQFSRNTTRNDLQDLSSNDSGKPTI